jgi:hypothetical protein
MIDGLQQRYDVRRRASGIPAQAPDDGNEEAVPEQAAFEWSDNGL